MARHRRAAGKGHDVTDPAHYPPTKRIGSQELHRQRLLTVRAAGPHSAQLLSRLRQGPWVFGEQLARLARLLESYGAPALERASERALFFGAVDGAKRIERILAGGFERLPLPNAPEHPRCSEQDFGRPLAEYDALLNGAEVAA